MPGCVAMARNKVFNEKESDEWQSVQHLGRLQALCRLP